MATITLQVADRFPAGTPLEAYPARISPSAEAKGEPAATAIVSDAGEAQFTGLAAGSEFNAGAEVDGKWRWIRFTTTGESRQGIEQPELGEGWTDYSGGNRVAQFTKSGGRVWLAGLISSKGKTEVTFRLPEGFRPDEDETFAAPGSDGTWTVRKNGDVVLSASGPVERVSLSGISFVPVG